MRFIISILLTLIFTILTVKVETKQEKNDRFTISNNLYLSSDSDNGTVPFVLGSSNQTRLEEAEAEQIRLASLYTRRTTAYGSSYTGQGQNVQIVGYSNEQCVIWFKKQKGINTSLGYAGNITPNSNKAEVGSGALERGHISLVIAIGDDWVRVREANWIRGAITERTIAKNQVRGYLII